MKSPWRHKSPGGHTAGELGHSRYGTPLREIVHAESDCDPLAWLLMPTNWADSGGMWEGPQDWADTTAPLCWGAWVETTPGAVAPGPEAVQLTALELKTYAEEFGGFDPQRPFEIVTYLYLPDPRKRSIPVHLWVDDRPGLTVEQATSDADAIEPPVREEFTTEALGTGVKTLSHGVLDPQPDDLPGTQQVWATVRYAFAVPGRQAIVTVKATHTDVALLNSAAADIDEFVRLITLSLADGTPVQVGPAPIQ